MAVITSYSIHYTKLYDGETLKPILKQMYLWGEIHKEKFNK